MTTELTKVAARILLVPSLLVAIGVMIKGYADPGDGFSAGVIAALGIALQLMVFGPDEIDRLPLIRYAPYAVVVGLVISLLTTFVPAVRGEALFTHWPPPGDEVVTFGTLELITAVAFDVGVFLLVFGFGVGVLSGFARAEARIRRAEERAARAARARVVDSSGGEGR